MNIFVGKLIEDKGDRVIIEVGKNELVNYDVQDGDQFYTLAFLEKEGKTLKSYDPFEKEVQ